MNDATKNDVQETRKFNLFCTHDQPCQEEFDSNDDATALWITCTQYLYLI